MSKINQFIGFGQIFTRKEDGVYETSREITEVSDLEVDEVLSIIDTDTLCFTARLHNGGEIPCLVGATAPLSVLDADFNDITDDTSTVFVPYEDCNGDDSEIEVCECCRGVGSEEEVRCLSCGGEGILY